MGHTGETDWPADTVGFHQGRTMFRCSIAESSFKHEPKQVFPLVRAAAYYLPLDKDEKHESLQVSSPDVVAPSGAGRSYSPGVENRISGQERQPFAL
jgi:hypothetical protein